MDEFDFVMISIINDRYDRNKIKDCNYWTYVLININDLIDRNNNCCYSSIKSNILEKNKIKITDDIRNKLKTRFNTI